MLLFTDETVMLYPGIGIIATLVYALLRPLPKPTRIFATTVVISGPIATIFLSYSLSRDALDIVLLLTLALLLLVANRTNDRSLMSVVVAASGLIIWTLHQSVFPFLVFMLLTFAILPRTEQVKPSFPLVIVALSLPIVIFSEPFKIFVGAITAVIAAIQDPSIGLSLFGANTASLKMTVTTPAPVPPEWLEPVVYGTLGVVTGLLFGAWLMIRSRTPEPVGAQLADYRTQHTLSVGFAFVGTTVLYIIRGFVFRSFVFWPIVFSVFLASLWRVSNSTNDILSPSLPDIQMRTVFVALLACILFANAIPILFPGYVENRPNVMSAQQYQSATFAENFDQGTPIYTDLLHSNAILLETDHRTIRNPKIVSQINRKPGLDQIGATLYDPSCDPHRYQLTSYQAPYGTTTWGGNIPSVSYETYTMGAKVYDNGVDAVHLFSGC